MLSRAQKKAIHNEVRAAVRSGVISKPSTCSVCYRENDKISAHHENYAAPLDVVWCCDFCHSMIHEHGLAAWRGYTAAAPARRRAMEKIALRELDLLGQSVRSMTASQLRQICEIRRA